MKKIKNKRKSLGSKKQNFEVLVEDLKSEFKLVAENTSELLKIKPVVERLSEDMEVVKTNTEFMKGNLKRKIDTEEFEALEHRVSQLENRR